MDLQKLAVKARGILLADYLAEKNEKKKNKLWKQKNTCHSIVHSTDPNP
jgi:hypothetical protein